MNRKCLRCQSQAIVEGKIYNQIDYINPPTYFRPDKVPFYATLFKNIKLPNNFFACASCGHIWSEMDSQKLQSCVTGQSAF